MAPHQTPLRAPICQIGKRAFRWDDRTWIMGIVNVTPDSFSGDGLLHDQSGERGDVTQAIVAHALRLLEEGADMVDIGGESTRPGSQPVDADTERQRVIPVIRQLRALTDAPISVDTYKASVAEAALDAGADLVNDVWGLQMDPALAPLIAERGKPVVIMHNRSKPKDAAQQERLGGRYIGVRYQDLMADILHELSVQVEWAQKAGIAAERIIIDPGIGFGKTVDQNLWLLNHVDALQVLGLPILLGPSRKSFIGYTLDLPPEQRLEGTLAAAVVGILRGAHILRVHDVAPLARAARMTDAILRAAHS
jgi:dihydropteroate synthase